MYLYDLNFVADKPCINQEVIMKESGKHMKTIIIPNAYQSTRTE